ncbi:hypothetical protein LY632_06500 [Erythrobacter sp. SDW2]|uniref:hypothetical protein n=1 Tax=Erythrobacter sp. SDW2 TaxID=2907154 RepID=UPI001F303187|nr:hypothetical protein [Erythrobacter sp. SDW2]UIP08038.1 hypothetical protein LY632_06500 [Erythrobacter sp. SDW2]
MKLKSLALGLAAMAAAIAPLGASSLSAQRASAPVESANQLEGNSGILIGVVAAAAIIAGIIIIADDDDPTSP